MKHRLARRASLTTSDLDGEEFISLDAADPFRTALDQHFVPDRRRLTLATPYTIAVCKLVSLGLGVSIVNPSLWNAFGLSIVKAIPFSPSIDYHSHVAT